MQQALNFNTTNLSKNNASSHGGLDDNYLESSVRSRRRLWRPPTILFKIRRRATLSRLFLAAGPEKSSFITTLAAGLRSLLPVHPAEWGAVFQSGPGLPGNGRMRFEGVNMIEIS
jgi:hypothetical protein